MIYRLRYNKVQFLSIHFVVTLATERQNSELLLVADDIFSSDKRFVT